NGPQGSRPPVSSPQFGSGPSISPGASTGFLADSNGICPINNSPHQSRINPRAARLSFRGSSAMRNARRICRHAGLEDPLGEFTCVISSALRRTAVDHRRTIVTTVTPDGDYTRDSHIALAKTYRPRAVNQKIRAAAVWDQSPAVCSGHLAQDIFRH